MAPVVPIIPAILALGSTIIEAATRKTPKPPPERRLDIPDIDEELRAAGRRKGRQIFAGESELLAGGKIGAPRTTGTDLTLVGN
jgi:hypothetical protein